MSTKYGRSEDNRAFGTALDLCVIEKIWSDGKNDFVRYYYNHPKRSVSYTAYLPKGNLAQVGVREGKMYKIWTSKINGHYMWTRVSELRMPDDSQPSSSPSIEAFFED